MLVKPSSTTSTKTILGGFLPLPVSFGKTRQTLRSALRDVDGKPSPVQRNGAQWRRVERPNLAQNPRFIFAQVGGLAISRIQSVSHLETQGDARRVASPLIDIQPPRNKRRPAGVRVHPGDASRLRRVIDNHPYPILTQAEYRAVRVSAQAQPRLEQQASCRAKDTVTPFALTERISFDFVQMNIAAVVVSYGQVFDWRVERQFVNACADNLHTSHTGANQETPDSGVSQRRGRVDALQDGVKLVRFGEVFFPFRRGVLRHQFANVLCDAARPVRPAQHATHQRQRFVDGIIRRGYTVGGCVFGFKPGDVSSQCGFTQLLLVLVCAFVPPFTERAQVVLVVFERIGADSLRSVCEVGIDNSREIACFHNALSRESEREHRVPFRCLSGRIQR